MQVHGPSDTISADQIRAYLNPGTRHPFAVVDMGVVQFFTEDPAECDAAIIAWTEAKRLLLGDPEPSWCPATTDLDGETLYCDRDPGHAGSHHAPGRDEGSEVAWSDEAGDAEAQYDAEFAADAASLDELEPLPAPRVIAGDFGATAIDGPGAA